MKIQLKEAHTAMAAEQCCVCSGGRNAHLVP